MYGFRVPLIVISKFARPGVSHVTHDFGSILTFIERNFGLSQMGDASSGTTSTTWNADGLAAARGDFLLDMFNFNGNIGFTAVSKLEHFRPIDAPLPPEWFVATKPRIRYPAIDSDFDDKPLTGAERAAFERVRQHSIHIVQTAIHEQEAGVKRLTLQQVVSSKMPSRMKFTAIDVTGKVFAGHIITQPAGPEISDGSLLLAFDDPFTVLNYGHQYLGNPEYRPHSRNGPVLMPRSRRPDDQTGTSRKSGTSFDAPSPPVTPVMLTRRNGDVTLPQGQVIEVKVQKGNQS